MGLLLFSLSTCLLNRYIKRIIDYRSTYSLHYLYDQYDYNIDIDH